MIKAAFKWLRTIHLDVVRLQPPTQAVEEDSASTCPPGGGWIWSVMSSEVRRDRDCEWWREDQGVVRATFKQHCCVHEGLVQRSPWIQAVEPRCSSVDAPAASQVGSM